jgi:YD repeat-containing protein
MRTKREGLIVFSVIILALISIAPAFGATVTYTYDSLNRLTKATYGNGVTEEYTYDAAGNRLTYVVSYETDSPSLSITSHINGQHVNSPNITLCGTASDAGSWGNGISQVLVNGVRANNDTALGSGTATWCIQLTLNSGANTITIIAYDNSGNQNPTIENLTLYYDEQAKLHLPLILR